MIHNLAEIKKIRKRVGLTQIELARISGVSQSLIAKVESGKIEPTFAKVKKISEALDNLNKKNNKRLSEIMVKKIIYCSKQDRVSVVIKKMKKYSISQLPVLESEKVIGLVTESTILEKISQGEVNELSAEDVMKESAPIVNHKSSIDVVSGLLKHFSIVLVSKKGKIIGLITKYDLLAVA